MNARRLLPAVLAAMVIVVWLPSLAWTFQFDDWSVIVADPRVASLEAWWRAMPATRPLTKLVHALGNAAGGTPALFRGFDIALHALNAVLVFSLARRLARRGRFADEPGSLIAGGVTAVVFALHPAQTDAVTYVSGGSQVLAATFALLSLAAFARFLDAPSSRRIGWWLASAVATAFALGARETAAVLPLVLALWAATERGDVRRLPWSALAGSTAVVLGLLGLGWATTAYPYLLSTSLDARGPLDNLGVATRGVFWLVGQVVRWDRLNADPALDAADPWAIADVARAFALVLCLAVAVWQWRARRWLSFGVLWFALWLAPTHTLIARLDLANDRQLYLPLVGPAFAASILVVRLRAQAPIAIALLAVVLAFAVASRNLAWRDEIALWNDVVAKSPGNARAHNNLGMAFAVACRPLAAAGEFEQAARLASDDPRPAINAALLERGELPGVPIGCPRAGDIVGDAPSVDRGDAN